MLRNTLIIPETDARLAARMIRDAIEALDVILMFVFGKSPDAKKAVEWADMLCEGTRTSATRTIRKVVWVRNPEPAAVKEVLNQIIETESMPLAAILNFHDENKGEIKVNDELDPLILEELFLKGH